MRSIFRSSGLAWGVVFVGFALAAAGCSCGGGSMIVPMPIMVSLPVSTVVVPQDGTQVIVPINITSTSETALVSVSGLPTGLQEKYAASDTNPSGSLAFTASAATPAGIYTPTVTVQSAGQTASTNFTLVVSAAKTENTTGVFANDAGRPRLNLGRIILGSIFRQTANQVAQTSAVIASAIRSGFVKKTEIPLGFAKWLTIACARRHMQEPDSAGSEGVKRTLMPQTQPVPYRQLLDNLRSPSQDRQNQAFHALLKASDSPVDWAYEVWDDLLRMLVDGDNRQRSIAAQVLSNLAKSDPKQRMLRDLAALLRVTKDERFVTARHCLQSLWKVGVAGEPQRKTLLKGLAGRFNECAAEKNYTLIRYDILVVLRRVYDVVNEDEHIRSIAERLIATEEDAKYRKKYATAWRK